MGAAVTFAQSHEHYARAVLVTPGASQTGSKAPGKVGPVGASPLYLARGEGAYVWDLDGHRYVDWFNGNCAVTLGHGYQPVVDAVTTAAKQGALLSLPSVREAEIAERLCAVIPCAEQVRFIKTGSEACAGAVRIARMATGRDVIVCVEGQYHGWFDWHCVTKPYHPGVPEALAALVRTFRYNDLDSLRGVLDDTVAAVILEPTLAEAPAEGFLRGVVDAAHGVGAVCIFDEMITGARWHIGGAQAFYGVTPDLATFGKAYANGVAFAFIAGRAELMRHAWPISGTFGGETLGLAACGAVLDAHQEEDAPVARMWRAGATLKTIVNAIAQRARFGAELVGPDVRPVWRWDMDAAVKPVAQALLQQELAARGVLVHLSGWNTSAVHGGVELDLTIDACRDSILLVAGYLTTPDPAVHLRGELLQAGLVRATR